jgi:hypothetical protein
VFRRFFVRRFSHHRRLSIGWLGNGSAGFQSEGLHPLEQPTTTLVS